MPTQNSNEELVNIYARCPKDKNGHSEIFENIVNSFKTLWGYNDSAYEIPNAEVDGTPVLLE
jgi:hypothetical protein